jgi:hypothetical protein
MHDKETAVIQMETKNGPLQGVPQLAIVKIKQLFDRAEFSARGGRVQFGRKHNATKLPRFGTRVVLRRGPVDPQSGQYTLDYTDWAVAPTEEEMKSRRSPRTPAHQRIIPITIICRAAVPRRMYA